jgi:hypothetical protein
MTITERIKKAAATYAKNPSNANLRAYLRLKAMAGRFDERMAAYYGVSTKVNPACKRAICRAYVAGLVPTSTTGGVHSPTSFHALGQAVDFGLRREEIGTAKGTKRLRTFQRKEFWRHRRGGLQRMVELIGPMNNRVILRAKETVLAEGAALENAHDNHVHEAYRNG